MKCLVGFTLFMKGVKNMLDNTDILILAELSKNSRITMKELGSKVHLTGPATSARVAKLEESGIIEGYTITVNQVKIGYLVHAIIHIFSKAQIINHICRSLTNNLNTSLTTTKSVEKVAIFSNVNSHPMTY